MAIPTGGSCSVAVSDHAGCCLGAGCGTARYPSAEAVPVPWCSSGAWYPNAAALPVPRRSSGAPVSRCSSTAWYPSAAVMPGTPVQQRCPCVPVQQYCRYPSAAVVPGTLVQQQWLLLFWLQQPKLNQGTGIQLLLLLDVRLQRPQISSCSSSS